MTGQKAGLAKAQVLAALTLTESLSQRMDPAKLRDLQNLLSGFASSGDPGAVKLSSLTRLVKPSITGRELYCIAVPLERYLQRTASDDQFLVTTNDRESATVQTRPLSFILDNLRSAFNVGSIFRLADCVGASEIAICGYTANPKDNVDLKKTSLGASDFVKYELYTDVHAAIAAAKQTKSKIIALETAGNAVSLDKADLRGPISVIVGNERFGLEADVLNQCDLIVKIPTFGRKNSLNVANALSIFSYEWSRQNS